MFPVHGKTVIGGPFGAFRADTGFHEGNDLFANFGTPVVAVADGTVENVGSLPISGNRLWVYADTGDQFFYAHLSAFSPNAVDHTRVKAGELLGYVGNTGDAEPTPPHLHFEIHPDGGKAVDPHPFLVVWQKRMGATAVRHRRAPRRPRRGPRLHRLGMSERPALIERLLARREQHLRRGRLYRIAFGALGGLILAAGVVMLVTPGPAFVLIPIGLAMLALEFEWAERLLEKALEQAEKARVKAATRRPRSACSAASRA